jgi:hypothetical protein
MYDFIMSVQSAPPSIAINIVRKLVFNERNCVCLTCSDFCVSLRLGAERSKSARLLWVGGGRVGYCEVDFVTAKAGVEAEVPEFAGANGLKAGLGVLFSAIDAGPRFEWKISGVSREPGRALTGVCGLRGVAIPAKGGNIAGAAFKAGLLASPPNENLGAVGVSSCDVSAAAATGASGFCGETFVANLPKAGADLAGVCANPPNAGLLALLDPELKPVNAGAGAEVLSVLVTAEDWPKPLNSDVGFADALVALVLSAVWPKEKEGVVLDPSLGVSAVDVDSPKPLKTGAVAVLVLPEDCPKENEGFEDDSCGLRVAKGFEAGGWEDTGLKRLVAGGLPFGGDPGGDIDMSPSLLRVGCFWPNPPNVDVGWELLVLLVWPNVKEGASFAGDALPVGWPKPLNAGVALLLLVLFPKENVGAAACCWVVACPWLIWLNGLDAVLLPPPKLKPVEFVLNGFAAGGWAVLPEPKPLNVGTLLVLALLPPKLKPVLVEGLLLLFVLVAPKPVKLGALFAAMLFAGDAAPNCGAPNVPVDDGAVLRFKGLILGFKSVSLTPCHCVTTMHNASTSLSLLLADRRIDLHTT